ncbi:MAG: hypothetical protein U0625_00500 [Phycisphaerales bacterium]
MSETFAAEAAGRQRAAWWIVLAAIAVLLAVRAFVGSSIEPGEGGGAAVRTHGFGLAYSSPEHHRFVKGEGGWTAAKPGEPAQIEWTTQNEATAREWAQQQAAGGGEIALNWPRTLGIWCAAFFTLASLSFLVKDNPAYKFTESVVVGVGAAYAMVVAFWDTLVPKLIGPLLPQLTRAFLAPGFEQESYDWHSAVALIPLALSVLLLCRLFEKTSKLGTLPLGFIVGTFAGLKFVQFTESDLLAQVATMFSPVIVTQNAAGASLPVADAVGSSLGAMIVLVGVLAVLVYFFFSLEHRGALGRTARVGVWYLMVTFGASFAFTVMGRIALLAARFEFLFDDWLWIIDPNGKH